MKTVVKIGWKLAEISKSQAGVVKCKTPLHNEMEFGIWF